MLKISNEPSGDGNIYWKYCNCQGFLEVRLQLLTGNSSVPEDTDKFPFSPWDPGLTQLTSVSAVISKEIVVHQKVQAHINVFLMELQSLSSALFSTSFNSSANQYLGIMSLPPKKILK